MGQSFIFVLFVAALVKYTTPPDAAVPCAACNFLIPPACLELRAEEQVRQDESLKCATAVRPAIPVADEASCRICRPPNIAPTRGLGSGRIGYGMKITAAIIACARTTMVGAPLDLWQAWCHHSIEVLTRFAGKVDYEWEPVTAQADNVPRTESYQGASSSAAVGSNETATVESVTQGLEQLATSPSGTAEYTTDRERGAARTSHRRHRDDRGQGTSRPAQQHAPAATGYSYSQCRRITTLLLSCLN
jgi:hypothetical protein